MSTQSSGNALKRLTNIKRLYPVQADSPEGSYIKDAVIQIQDQTILWVGEKAQAPALQEGEEVIDLNGAMVTPGWVDSHTHLIWAGNRQNEFRARLEGATYLDIAKAGGGIMSTCRNVRQTHLEDLVDLARPRLARMLQFGVTTAEVKSGYALETESELRMLRAAKQLGEEGPIELTRTFLGAHTIPTEYKPKRDAYLDLVCKEMIPRVVEEQLADSCDVFLEEGAFNLEEARRVLQCGLDAGLMPRIHADQLSAGGGAELAAELKAASADHLEEISEQGIKALADNDVVACLIPGSTFCLRQDKYAPARQMLDAGVTISIATDLNPGTTCSENLAFIGTMACIHMRLTPYEVLKALTYGGAKSLKREDRIGSIAPGYQADLAVFAAPDIDYIFYHYAVSHVTQVFKKGQQVWSKGTSSVYG